MKKINIQLITLLFIAFGTGVFVQVNKMPFYVSVTGKGIKTIVFIRGFACSGEVWNETKAQYEAKFNCYTLTMAGFAGIAPQDNATFKGWENAIATFMTRNKINNTTLIGHSLGGCLALALAADFPKLVSNIVVVDALPCLAAMMDPSFKSKLNNNCTALVAQLTSMTDDQFYKMQLLGIARLLADTQRVKQVVGWSVKSDRKTFAQMYCDFSNTDLTETIANIQCPALILLESYFSNFKPAIEAQYINLKNAQLRYATKGFHFVMCDDTAWYNEQLAGFVK